MSALPPHEMRAMRETAQQAMQPVGSLAQRWEDLHLQASELANLAQLGAEKADSKSADFATLLNNAHEWQRELAWQGVEDIDAMMRPGLTALKVLTARGQDAAPPAMALWREFHLAREAVLASVAVEPASAR